MLSVWSLFDVFIGTLHIFVNVGYFSQDYYSTIEHQQKGAQKYLIMTKLMKSMLSMAKSLQKSLLCCTVKKLFYWHNQFNKISRKVP